MNENQRALVILCVDDDSRALAVRASVLEGAGYKVLQATSGHQAIQLFQQNTVHLVLTDHLLKHGGTGTELMKYVRRLKPKIPIAIYSGVTETPEDATNADAFISKTAGPTQFLVEVAKLLKL